MFDVVEGFEFGKGVRRTRKSRYDWDLLLDGKVRKVTQEDLGDTQVKSFLALLYGKVKDRGVKVRTAKQADGSLIIQAILPEKSTTTPSTPVAAHEQEGSEASHEESNGEEFVVEEGSDESEEAAEEVEIPTPSRAAHSARKATSRGVR